MADLTILGSVNLDVVLRVASLPRPGETVSATGSDHYLGGKGANQAVAAARSGVNLEFYACLGDDEDGAWLISELEVLSVPSGDIEKLPSMRSGRAYICVDAAGENHIVVDAGANAQLKVVPPKRADAKVVLSQLETPIETTLAYCASLAGSNTTAVLNAAPAILRARDDLFHVMNIIVMNESELAFYAEIESLPEDIEDITRIARTLLSRADQVIIVTCGAAGALAISRNHLHVTPARRTKARDTTGSGDCFCGTLCARLAVGDQLDAAMQYASIAASLSVEKDGAAASMPSREDVELIIFEMESEEVPG